MKPSLVDRARRVIREALTQNVRLKALAMILTIFVFILVRGGRDATARITVDVEYIPPTQMSDRVLMTEIPETVKLRVSGSPRVVQLATEDEPPPLTLDLRDQRDGPFMLDEALFRVSPGLEVVSVRPATIGLRYETRIRRDVQVHPVVTGHVAEGHHVKDPIIAEPSKVKLSGPQSVMRDYQEVQTDPIPVEGLGPGQHKRQILLVPPPPNCNYENVDMVTVMLVVEPDLVDRSFEDIPVEVRGSNLQASAERITVIVRGLPSVVEQVQQNDLVVFVDLGDDGSLPGTYRREVQIAGLDPTVQARPVPTAVIVEVQRIALPQDTETTP